MNFRASLATKIESGVLTAVTIIVGIALMASGLIGAIWTVEHAKDGHADHPTLYVCVGLAVLGALMLPGIFTVVKPIFVLVFPGGLPFIGGRRASDPPPPPDTKG